MGEKKNSIEKQSMLCFLLTKNCKLYILEQYNFLLKLKTTLLNSSEFIIDFKKELQLLSG
jgi:hypothetical protein